MGHERKNEDQLKSKYCSNTFFQGPFFQTSIPISFCTYCGWRKVHKDTCDGD